MITVELADAAGLDWAQQHVIDHHYLHTPVDSRSSPLAYLVKLGRRNVGCLIFGRAQASCCYQGKLRYGSVEDIQSGRADCSRWELVNLARVWLDPGIQHGGMDYIHNAASRAAAAALRLVVHDYLVAYPPCFLDEPWKLRWCISYCDAKQHAGTLYRALGFELVHTNDDGLQTWARRLRGLQPHERRRIERLAEQSARSRHYRSMRAAGEVVQLAAEFEEV